MLYEIHRSLRVETRGTREIAGGENRVSKIRSLGTP